MRKVQFKIKAKSTYPLLNGVSDEDIWVLGVFHQWINKPTCCEGIFECRGLIEDEDGKMHKIEPLDIRFVK